MRLSFRKLALALGVALASLAPHVARAQGFVVVVNASGPSSISKADLAKVFLKKSSSLVAVDQEKSAKVRDAFSQSVHGKPASAIVSFWQQQIFAGKDVPPAEKGSDADVIAFVKSNPKGVGYVASGTSLGDGVKAVTLQ